MKKTYINKISGRIKHLTFIGGMSLLVLSSCTDELLYDDSTLLSTGEYVSFSASVSAVNEPSTRSEKELYSPLVLNVDNEDFPLYLHTYEHPAGDEKMTENTRGLQVDDTESFYDIHGSFGVHASAEGSSDNYIPLQETRLVSTTDKRVWITETPLKWLGTTKLSFHAIAPYSGISDHSGLTFETNRISFSYSALKGSGNNDAEKQQDVMIATANLNRAETSDYNFRVPLKFHHSLSAIKFAVRDVLKGKVKSIAIKGVYGTGDCVFTANDNGSDGVFDWSNQRNPDNYTQIFDHEIENGNFDSTDDSNDVVLSDKMPEKTFMMIPQQIPADAEIEVEIERYDVAPGLSSTIKVRGKIRSNNLTEWKAGYEYIYTISTSKDNWVNVFEATGNDAEGNKNIYVYSPNDDNFDKYENTAWFDVKSYRYKANDMKYIEPLPWVASHGGSLSYNIEGGSEIAYPLANPEIKRVTASQWISDRSSTPLKGSGTGTATEFDRHELDFLPHYVSTNWKGDEQMQGYKPYSGFDRSAPYDLSTFGGKRSRTTANCYVIDRGGWYMFPMIYGNAIKNGSTNEKAYKSQSTSSDASLKLLSVMVNHNNSAITSPQISVPAKGYAELVWQDAYQLVENIELVTVNGEKMIRFYVDPNNIQQGNAMIALKNGSGTILWSWHIWTTEHWIDVNTRLPHVYDKNNSSFTTFTKNSVTGIRERGDVEVTYNQKNRSFMMAPYNIGWCDPKKVIYLKRKSDMKFVQYAADGVTPTGKTATLPIIQQGEVIDYKYSNNTYYQWGRKDPMRGYVDHEHLLKRVFGPKETTPQMAYLENGAPNIGTSIKNPHLFYVSKSGVSGSKYEDWLTTNFKSNLWNNHSKISLEARDDDNDHADMWSHTKTIYDPSPAGYMIPNAGVWHVIQKKWGSSGGDSWAGGNWKLSTFKNKINGARIDDYNYKVWATGVEGDDSKALFFSSTGNRWWTGGWNPGNYIGGVGGNFGKNVSYAWSNRAYINNQSQSNSYGMALGLDTDRDVDGADATKMYYVGGQFIGRRTMGRPVRSIREP